MYKILERMAEMGWETARWDDRPSEPNKPRRRHNKLTGDGMARARTLVRDVCGRRSAV